MRMHASDNLFFGGDIFFSSFKRRIFLGRKIFFFFLRNKNKAKEKKKQNGEEEEGEKKQQQQQTDKKEEEEEEGRSAIFEGDEFPELTVSVILAEHRAGECPAIFQYCVKSSEAILDLSARKRSLASQRPITLGLFFSFNHLSLFSSARETSVAPLTRKAVEDIYLSLIHI